jgi:hypothetical protein
MKKISFVLFVALVFGFTARAQVRIGTLDVPHGGSILDISTAHAGNQKVDLGLLLPQVELADVDEFQLNCKDCTADSLLKAKGMVIYNTSSTTIGGGGATGEFIWDGKKWRPVFDGGNMRLITVNNLALTKDNAMADDGSQTAFATVLSEDCENSGEYQFILLSGDANISPTSSPNAEFELVFNPNPYGSMRQAVVQVVNPCFKTGIWVFYQEGADCDKRYKVLQTAFHEDVNFICNGGAVYPYVVSIQEIDEKGIPLDDPINDPAVLYDINFSWMLGNTIIADGFSPSITKPGRYMVYAGMLGCGVPNYVTVSGESSKTSPPEHTLIVSNDGIICGNSLSSIVSVKLTVLNFDRATEKLLWFHNGVHMIVYDDTNPIYLSQPDDVGNWFAVIKNNASDCLSRPTKSATITYNSTQESITAPVALINGTPFDEADITICANSTVRLEIKDYKEYPDTRQFYWYLNGELWGESKGEAIYIIPENLETCIISVKMVLSSNQCPVSVSTNEMRVNMQENPITPVIMWKGESVPIAYICRDNPAVLYCSASGQAEYQWFRNGSTEPLPAQIGIAKGTYYASETGIYQVRYKNLSGCWSYVSDPITVSISSPPFMDWAIAPDTVPYELYSSERTFSVSTAPAATEYSWRVYQGSKEVTEIQLTPIGDNSTVMVKFPPYETLHNSEHDYVFESTRMKGLMLEVRAINSCGEGVLTKEFWLDEGCQPISALELEGSAVQLTVGQSIDYRATVSSGTSPYYYSGWVYVENSNQTIIPELISKGTTIPNGKYTWHVYENGIANIDFWVTDPEPESGFTPGSGQGQYKKMLFLPWQNKVNMMTVVAFAPGTHYIQCAVANNMSGLSMSSSDGTYFSATPDGNGAYSGSTTDNTCTPWHTPVVSRRIQLKVFRDPDLARVGPPNDGYINYTQFLNGKTCLDVHKTEDAQTQAWGTNRLPRNVRPNDFASTVNGEYVFSYKFTGGFWTWTSTSGTYAIPVSTTKTTWQTVVSSIEYVYRDPFNLVSSISGNGTETVTIRLKGTTPTASGVIGSTRQNPAQFTIYALYSYNGQTWKDSINVKIQDAACGCPAKMSNSTWHLDMCHAAGANYSQTPFGNTETTINYGKYYKWGNSHPVATFNRNATMHRDNLSNQYAFYYDSDNNGTNDGKGEWNMEYQNPCPRGWRVARWSELEKIADPSLNARTGVVSDAGEYGFQMRGYVPIAGGGYATIATGNNNVGDIIEEANCHTWSATTNDAQIAPNKYFYHQASADDGYQYGKGYGEHIRCVQEGSDYTGQ